MRLIDADALLKKLKADRARFEDSAKTYWEDKSGVIAMSEAIYEAGHAPTIEAEPVRHGEWVHAKTYYDADECNCSLCGQLMTTEIGKRMNYCPNCGAKMDKEDV